MQQEGELNIAAVGKCKRDEGIVSDLPGSAGTVSVSSRLMSLAP